MIPPLILLYEGVSGYEAMGAHAALRAAGRAAEFVARDALVATREGVRIVPHRLGFSTLADADAAILPDGSGRLPLHDADLTRALRARRGRWVLASGDAVRLAEAADLTAGRRVARSPGVEPLAGTESRPARLVADGRLLTCAGGDALVDLALHYVAQTGSAEDAARAAHAMGREHRPFVLGATTDGA